MKNEFENVFFQRLLRKLQCWNLSSVIGEFCRFVRGSHIHPGEAQFVER